MNYKYLIVGGGMAAHAAVLGIRSLDKDAPIRIVSAEPDPPYRRPPLTKDLWKGKKPESIWYKTAELGVDLQLKRSVVRIEPSARRVYDDRGEECTYEKLLLATGGTPRRLPFGDGVNYLRTFRDYTALREATTRGKRFVVIGGGFIGSEIAAALAMNGKQTVLVLRGASIGSHVYPEDLSHFLTDYYREKGVEVLTQTDVIGIELKDDRFTVRIRGGDESAESAVGCDGVVAGLGIEPNVELARRAGLSIDDGVVVDEHLTTTEPDIFAAGDVAAFVNPALSRRIRVEHEDNAKTMGRVAGENMAGGTAAYHHLPFFYSDLFELGYEAVGELDARLETVSDWKDPHREGVVYYLHAGRVRGVLLWNVWGQVDAARRLIADVGPFTPENLRRRLPEIDS